MGRKASLFIALLCLALLLSACGKAADPESTVPEKTVPEEMRELANSGNVERMAGLWAELTNYTKISEDNIPNGEVYRPENAPISAKVTLQNGLEKPQPFFLVLADGAPVEFQQ